MKLLGDLGQRPSLPGHAIAGWGFKTSIVMLPLVMLKARATSRTSFAMGESPLTNAMLALHVGRACERSILNEGVAQPLFVDMKWAPAEADARFTQSLVRAVMVAGPPIRATRGHGAMP